MCLQSHQKITRSERNYQALLQNKTKLQNAHYYLIESLLLNLVKKKQVKTTTVIISTPVKKSLIEEKEKKKKRWKIMKDQLKMLKENYDLKKSAAEKQKMMLSVQFVKKCTLIRHMNRMNPAWELFNIWRWTICLWLLLRRFTN